MAMPFGLDKCSVGVYPDSNLIVLNGFENNNLIVILFKDKIAIDIGLCLDDNDKPLAVCAANNTLLLLSQKCIFQYDFISKAWKIIDEFEQKVWRSPRLSIHGVAYVLNDEIKIRTLPEKKEIFVDEFKCG